MLADWERGSPIDDGFDIAFPPIAITIPGTKQPF
jgi:hypothetical protein